MFRSKNFCSVFGLAIFWCGIVLLFLLSLSLVKVVNAQLTDQATLRIAVWVGPPPPTTPPTPPGHTIPPLTKVIFRGRAYPSALITILKDGEVTATFKAFESGVFEKQLTGLAGGTYTFGFWAEDTEGRESVTLTFIIDVLPQRITTISGIFIPPTIELNSLQVRQGEDIVISGQAYPTSQIFLFISPDNLVEDTLTDEKGKWTFTLDTSLLPEGEHEIKAQALYKDGQQSPFSQTVNFLVLPPELPPPPPFVCRGADLNFDGNVDLVDFSILLYYWEQREPENVCADINQDGIVDLVDFSIMMYEWTG